MKATKINTPKYGTCYHCDKETICLITSGILLCEKCIDENETDEMIDEVCFGRRMM